MPWRIQGGGPTPWGKEQRTTGWTAPDWDKEVGKFRIANNGAGIDRFCIDLYDSAPLIHPERLPTKLFWEMNGKQPPSDCFSIFEHFVVSPRLRDMIEDLEPGVHEFFQVDLVHRLTKEPWPEPYWFLHIRNVIDGVIDELSEIKRIATRGPFSPSVESPAGVWSTKGHGTLVLRASEVGDKHLWRDVGSLIDKFGSDEFVKELEAREIKGIGVPKHYEMR